MNPVIQSSPVDLDGCRHHATLHHHTALHMPELEREAKDEKP